MHAIVVHYPKRLDVITTTEAWPNVDVRVFHIVLKKVFYLV